MNIDWELDEKMFLENKVIYIFLIIEIKIKIGLLLEIIWEKNIIWF